MSHEYTLHCKLSQYAYLDSKDFLARCKKEFGFKGKFSSIRGSDVGIVWDKDRAILVCRGTQGTSFNDIKADMKAYKTKFQGICWAHDGFKDEVEKNLDWVCNTFKDNELYMKNISICGHSLGGAMAHLFALYFAEYKSQKVTLYTYGSPRVGGWTFNRLMKQNHIEHHRFRNNNDIVPTVPFAILGYKHYGKLHYINYYGNVRKATFWQRLKDKFRGRWKALQKGQPFDGIFDHSIGLYKQKISKQFK